MRAITGSQVRELSLRAFCAHVVADASGKLAHVLRAESPKPRRLGLQLMHHLKWRFELCFFHVVVWHNGSKDHTLLGTFMSCRQERRSRQSSLASGRRSRQNTCCELGSAFGHTDQQMLPMTGEADK